MQEGTYGTAEARSRGIALEISRNLRKCSKGTAAWKPSLLHPVVNWRGLVKRIGPFVAVLLIGDGIAVDRTLEEVNGACAEVEHALAVYERSGPPAPASRWLVAAELTIERRLNPDES